MGFNTICDHCGGNNANYSVVICNEGVFMKSYNLCYYCKHVIEQQINGDYIQVTKANINGVK